MKRPTINDGAFGARERSGSTRSSSFWTRIIGISFAGLLLVGVAMFRALPAPGRPPGAPASASVGRTADHSLSHYLQSGQWRADMRTLVSMFRYLVTPETATVTNRPVMPA
jgi:hypothetical protein